MLEKYPIRKIEAKDLSLSLLEIPEPPGTLYIRGNLPPQNFIYLTVVGSRKASSYGKDATKKIISGLAGYPIVIVSGLAIGIDSIAHNAALDAGIFTMSFPGSGLGEKFIAPSSHLPLAKNILDAGGCLVSEMNSDEHGQAWTFPRRNRLMAGISKAVLVVEAEKPSGTLITSKLATDYNRDVFAVPGSIFSKNSEGPHMLIKLGATPVENSDDVLEALGIKPSNAVGQLPLLDLSKEEKTLLDILAVPSSRDEISEKLDWDISKISETLTLLEIKGVIKEHLGKIHLA